MRHYDHTVIIWGWGHRAWHQLGRESTPGHVRVRCGFSSASCPWITLDVLGTWKTVDGRARSGPPCRGSLSITTASYAPPGTMFNIMSNSSLCWDTCSHCYMMISRRLPGPPNIWLSGSRTPWLLSLQARNDGMHEVKNHAVRPVGPMNLAIRGHFQINFLEWKCVIFH